MRKKLINVILINFIFFFYFQKTFAELLKPDREYKAIEVVKIQLNALKNNDTPYKDAGIKQTWEFSHPSNKEFTGPLSKFIKLLKDKNYNILLNHIDNKIVEIFKSKEKFIYEVTILDSENFFFKYQWQVEKFLSKGSLNNCWLTTSVSLPQLLGSSI